MADQRKLILKSITWSDYNTLVNNNTLDPKTLYFITDKGFLYTHNKLYSGKYEFYTTVPQNPELNTLYINQANMSAMIWDGTDWVETAKGYSLSVDEYSTHDTVPTSKAVYDLVSTYTPGGGTSVHIDTTANWNAQSTLIGQRGHIYIYSDKDIVDGTAIPAMKVGDGSSYLIDNPFVDANTKEVYDHVTNTDIHITSLEREFWNDKVTCFMSDNDNETLVFSKD